MQTDLDVNKLAAEFIQANLESAWSLVTSHVKGARNVVRSKFERTYRSYLERVLDRYSRGKSFFIRSEPVPLYDFFVPLDLATHRRLLRKPSATNMSDVSRRCIITGSGGSGKTMMMRHILITTIVGRAKTPVFLELRQLNQSDEGVRPALLRILQTNGLDVDDDYLELALAAGHLCVMLDGFDELQQSRRRAIAKEIQELAEKYPSNWFIMSSRPDSTLKGWDSFVEFRVHPLDLERAAELVHKLPFDDPVKEKFVADLRGSLFARHQSFLSNPLLLSIMLLTYSDVAQIPDKLSIFYGQAYESLFQKHDALKGGFQRERRSGLDIQDFERAFSAFCIQSYDRREFSFSESRALEILERAKKLTGVVYESHALLDDALQAVCLLVEEGLEITFAHRSFQEYFVARFIHSSPPEIKPKLTKGLAAIESDAVMSLLHEMDPYIVEKHYILPGIDMLKKRIGLVGDLGVSHFLRYLKQVWRAFEAIPPDDTRGYFGDSSLFNVLLFAWARYGAVRGRLTKEQIAAEYKAIAKASAEGHRVETRSLTTRTELVRFLFQEDVPSVYHATFLRDLLSIERLIKQRHQDAQRSLEAILAGNGHK